MAIGTENNWHIVFLFVVTDCPSISGGDGAPPLQLDSFPIPLADTAPLAGAEEPPVLRRNAAPGETDVAGQRCRPPCGGGVSLTWKSGKFNRGEANFSAHSCCIIQDPELSFVKVGGSGSYSIETQRGVTVGNIFNNSLPRPQKARYGEIRSVSEIGSKAYAVGLRGMVYRLDDTKRWTRLDEGLPESFNIQAIHGFRASDLYAVGRSGDFWHFNGKK